MVQINPEQKYKIIWENTKVFQLNFFSNLAICYLEESQFET